jgi:hypothetical protein
MWGAPILNTGVRGCRDGTEQPKSRLEKEALCRLEPRRPPAALHQLPQVAQWQAGVATVLLNSDGIPTEHLFQGVTSHLAFRRGDVAKPDVCGVVQRHIPRVGTVHRCPIPHPSLDPGHPDSNPSRCCPGQPLGPLRGSWLNGGKSIHWQLWLPQGHFLTRP